MIKDEKSTPKNKRKRMKDKGEKEEETTEGRKEGKNKHWHA